MNIIDNWLYGNNVYKKRSPNIGAELLADTIILHYTAGDTAEGSVAHLIDPKNEVSAHLVISRDLRIFQLVPFNKIAWHAGKSKWKDRESLNRYSIGIEIDNAGKLEKINDRFYSWFGKEYQLEDIIQAKHKNSDKLDYWHKYDNSQLELAKNVCKLIISTYPISEIIGHDEIAPDRKIDPGPAFPIEDFKSLITSS